MRDRAKVSPAKAEVTLKVADRIEQQLGDGRVGAGKGKQWVRGSDRDGGRTREHRQQMRGEGRSQTA